MKTRVNWDSLLLRPASERYVPVADGLRALCVGVVMWFHIWQQSWLNPSILGEDFNWLVRSGYMLVEPLLTLSGFLLFLPWARARTATVRRKPRRAPTGGRAESRSASEAAPPAYSRCAPAS